jgi:hypothetical protein
VEGALPEVYKGGDAKALSLGRSMVPPVVVMVLLQQPTSVPSAAVAAAAAAGRVLYRV